MEEEKEIVCDFTTGVCGPVGENKGIMEFVDLSVSKEETEESLNKEQSNEVK